MTTLMSIQGVEAHEIVNTSTIMSPELFKKVAAVAHLKKSQLKLADKTSYTYNHKPFKLDGKLDLHVYTTFQG